LIFGAIFVLNLAVLYYLMASMS